MNNTAILGKLQKLLTQIPAGKVTTYKKLGEKLCAHPRQVGKLLHANEDPAQYPCHRVVMSSCKLAAGYAFGGIAAQRRKLNSEGVQFDKYDRVEYSCLC